LDSLWNVWENESESDTNRLKAIKEYTWNGYLFSKPDSAIILSQLLIDYAVEKNVKKHIGVGYNIQGIATYFLGDYDGAISFYNKALVAERDVGNQKGVGNALSNLGLVYHITGDYTKAIDHHKKSLEIRKSIGDKTGIASSLGNLGIIYQDHAEYDLAIDYHMQCLKINEELDNKQGVANCYGNIGVIYDEIKDYDKAIEYINSSLEIFKEIDNKQGASTALNSIGNVYREQKKMENARNYYLDSYEIRKEIGDKKGMATSLDNIGIVYREEWENKKALEYFNQALLIRQEIGDKKGESYSLTHIGNVYAIENNYSQAIHYTSKAYDIAEELGVPALTKTVSKSLYNDYKAVNQYKLALEMYEVFIAARDSLLSESNKKAVIRQEFKYVYEKKAEEDSLTNIIQQNLKDAEILAERTEKEHHQVQSYYLFAGLGLALIFGGFIYNRFKVTDKQKLIIEEQKRIVDKSYDELEIKNTEILDSIIYAKRIQSAIMPTDSFVEEHLKDSFVLYKPKDVVAGDFYWIEKKDNKILFAAADCTGHGVPGALVSVVCNNALNRSVREYGLSDPDKILNKVRDIVVAEFEKSDEDVNDGMDIALCSIDGMDLKYAGAFNPLWVVREGELIVIKADKFSIGQFDADKNFTCHSMELKKNDVVYLFSDGYVDQFGGENGKKFKTRAFMELVKKHSKKSMKEQYAIFNEVFESWKGDLDQIDDVCVIGVRV
jgi:serine phosphatase RsbU (regulator of sigma subunit)/uncharacterized protein HemY